MIKDQHSDECIDAFEQYLKDTKDYNRRVSHGDSLSYTDDELYIWQNAWRSCINQNASFSHENKVKLISLKCIDVTSLREETQETIGRCVKALVSCDGDTAKAKHWLLVNKPNYVWNGK